MTPAGIALAKSCAAEYNSLPVRSKVSFKIARSWKSKVGAIKASIAYAATFPTAGVFNSDDSEWLNKMIINAQMKAAEIMPDPQRNPGSMTNAALAMLREAAASAHETTIVIIAHVLEWQMRAIAPIPTPNNKAAGGV